MTPSLPVNIAQRFERTIMKKYALLGIIAGAMSMLPALSQTSGDSRPSTNLAPNAAANAEATHASALARGVYPAGPGGRNTPLARPPRPDPLPAFYDPKLPVQKRVEDLVSRLTLEEKVALMQMASPSIPRLGIAPYHWWTEALHGMTHDTVDGLPAGHRSVGHLGHRSPLQGRHRHQHRRPRQEL